MKGYSTSFKVIMRTITGQCLDMVASRPNEPLDLSQFTSQRYDVIVKYKTAHYSFYLPVALAMHFVRWVKYDSAIIDKTLID